jgi:hypothetical protein
VLAQEVPISLLLVLLMEFLLVFILITPLHALWLHQAVSFNANKVSGLILILVNRVMQEHRLLLLVLQLLLHVLLVLPAKYVLNNHIPMF